jgi:hypothetical protein
MSRVSIVQVYDVPVLRGPVGVLVLSVGSVPQTSGGVICELVKLLLLLELLPGICQM